MITDAPFSPDDIEAVLFDMDGTLVDTDNVDVAKWARRIARIYRSPNARRKNARKLVMALETPMNAVFTVLDAVGLDTPVVRLMIRLQGGTDQGDMMPPVDGVVDLIKQLADRYRLGVVSTREVKESEKFLVSLGVREYFEVIAGRDSTWRIKPHPQPVRYAANKLGIDPKRCLMVGDTTVDAKAGLRAGSWTVSVLCGYGERAELERTGTHLILEHTSQLRDLLL
ncbi:MAG: HAD family hydrolase [Anaerolineae bacterium]|nr:HAD family hydrolase [Anaerolineae bacterium]